MKKTFASRMCGSLIAACLFGASIAGAAEIRVMGGSAVIPVMNELVPQFERATGHTVRTDFDGAIGAMTARVRRGEDTDVIIVSGDQIDMLQKENKVLPGSRTDLAKVGVGVFVRKGAAKPHIGSVEDFTRTMLAAGSIGYNDPDAGAPVGLYLLTLFERLGIAERMTAKTIVFKQRSERFEAVARGEVEIGFNQISEILAAPGVDLVGPLPDLIQRHTLLAAGIAAKAREHQAAWAFVQFIASPDAKAVWAAKGFEPP
jgi:molybdate transport system substrate-binding protein